MARPSHAGGRPAAKPPQRRWAAVAGATIVMVIGGFVSLVLLWWASWNNGPWTATPDDRRQRLTACAIVFGLTVSSAVLMLWLGFRRRDQPPS